MYFCHRIKGTKKETERPEEVSKRQKKRKQRIKLGSKEAIYTKMTRYLFPRNLHKEESRRPPISVMQILQKKRLSNFLAKFKSHHLSNED